MKQEDKAPPFWSLKGFDDRFFFWTILLVAGYAYVQTVLCHRPNPFASRGGGYSDIIKMLAAAPLLYFVGPRANLESFLHEDKRRVLLWNGLGYVLPYFIGLHWLYLQTIPQINYSLTWHDLTHMHPVGKVVFLAGGVLILGLVIYHLLLAYREGILVPYISTFLAGILVIAGISWMLRGRYTPHIHHYFFFGYFIAWARFRTPVSLVCQGLCAGVYVEGISEWGMSALWDQIH